MVKILEMPKRPADAERLIRQLAEDSARVIWSEHVMKRMAERDISAAQVMRCLRAGKVTEGPAPMVNGNSRVTMQAYTSGHMLRIVVVIDWKAKLILVTVYD